MLEKMIVEEEKEVLRFNYKPKNERSVFDVCDLYGRILYTSLIPSTGIIDLSSITLEKGIYRLVVIDGDSIIEKRISIPAKN